MSEGKINTDKWFPVNLVDPADLVTGQAGKVVGDLTVKYKISSDTNYSAYSPIAADWREKSVSGRYDIRIGASEFTANGEYEVVVECAGCYPYSFLLDVGPKYSYETMDDVTTLTTRIPSALNISGGVVESNLVAIKGTTIPQNVPGLLAGNWATFFNNTDVVNTKVVGQVGTTALQGPVSNVSDGEVLTSGLKTSGSYIDTQIDNLDSVTVQVDAGLMEYDLTFNAGAGESIKEVELNIDINSNATRTMFIQLYNYNTTNFVTFKTLLSGLSQRVLIESITSDFTDTNGDVIIKFINNDMANGQTIDILYARTIHIANTGTVPSTSEIALAVDQLLSYNHGNKIWNGMDIENTNIESISDQKTFVIKNGPVDANSIEGAWVVLTDQTNGRNYGYGNVKIYDPGTRQITLNNDATITISAGFEFRAIVSPPVDLFAINGARIPVETPGNEGTMANSFYNFFFNGGTISTATQDMISSTNTTVGTINSKIGTPLSISGGSATLAGMITQIFDNNGGASYDPATDSLHELTGIIVEAVPSNITSYNETLNAGVINSGDYTNTWTNDGVYLNASSNGTNALDIELLFNISDKSPSTLTVNGRVDTAPGTLWANVYAWNYVSLGWDQLSDAANRIEEASVDADKSFTLTANNKESVTGNMRIRFLANSTAATTNLLLDQVIVKAVSAAATPAQIAEAVYSKMSLSIYGYTIHIDTVNGTPGTDVGINGLPGNPVDNISDAIALANLIGVRAFTVNTGSTLVLDRDFERWVFVGLSSIINLNGWDIDGCLFKNFVITGNALSASGRPIFENCNFLTCSLPPCVIRTSGISGSITMNTAGTYVLDRCSSGVPGQGSPGYIFTNGVQLNNRHYSGGSELFDMDVSNIATIEGFGQVKLDNSCTGGALSVRGTFDKTDNTNGGAGGAVTISENARYCVKQIRDSMRLNGVGTIEAASIEGKIDSIISDGSKEATLNTVDGKIDASLSATSSIQSDILIIDSNINSMNILLNTVDGNVDTIILNGAKDATVAKETTLSAVQSAMALDSTVAKDLTVAKEASLTLMDGKLDTLVTGSGNIYIDTQSILTNMALDTDVTAIKVVTDILSGMYENSLGYRWTAKSLEESPTGGGGVTDWTISEREEMRQILGITGAKVAAGGGGDFQALDSKIALDSTVAKETTLSAVGVVVSGIDTNVDSVINDTTNILATMALDATVAKETTVVTIPEDVMTSIVYQHPTDPLHIYDLRRTMHRALLYTSGKVVRDVTPGDAFPRWNYIEMGYGTIANSIFSFIKDGADPQDRKVENV